MTWSKGGLYVPNDERERVGIVGSRGYPHLTAVREYVRALGDVVVVTGCAGGVDAVARESAKLFHQGLHVHRADWAKYGASAGPRRNRLLVADVARLVAFWDGTSPGTAHAIKAAREHGVPVVVVPPGAGVPRP